jgi:hypothetical protein
MMVAAVNGRGEATLGSLPISSKSWFSTLTDACMHRVTPANPATEDAISVRRGTFDGLVHIGQRATDANGFVAEGTVYTITEAGGRVTATARHELFGEVQVEADSLVEAVVEVKRQLRFKVEERIR